MQQNLSNIAENLMNFTYHMWNIYFWTLSNTHQWQNKMQHWNSYQLHKIFT